MKARNLGRHGFSTCMINKGIMNWLGGGKVFGESRACSWAYTLVIQYADMN